MSETNKYNGFINSIGIDATKIESSQHMYSTMDWSKTDPYTGLGQVSNNYRVELIDGTRGVLTNSPSGASFTPESVSDGTGKSK